MFETTVALGEYRIITIMTGEHWRENCYVVRHIASREQVLIDPGDNADSIVQAVLDGGAQLCHILLTHAHHDHVGAVATLCRHFNLACNVHKDDVRLLLHAPMYALRFARKQIETPDRVVPFGQPSFSLGGRSIGVIHTPGHTPGSVCYSFDKFVLTGDTILNQHIGRTDLPGGDPALLSTSVNHLLVYFPEDTVLFPGHGQPWIIREARVWWQKVSDSPPQFNELGA